MADHDFSVFMADLLRAAGVFRQQSGLLSQIMPGGGGAVPNAGSQDVDSAMRQAAQLPGELHSQLASAISHHGTDLRDAYDTYDKTDIQLSQLAGRITNPDTI
jgi:hypothetical protein